MNNEFFDKIKWSKAIKKSGWYFLLAEEYQRLKRLKDEISKKDSESIKKVTYDFFETHLLAGDIALGDSGKDFDKERKPIDTIIIHHTHNLPGISIERLSAISLVRLYATFYADPYIEDDKEIKGEPIYSGHFKDGKQVFYPYHWVVRTNGKAERLLSDEEIGWHAGDWDINCRSVAIVLDNNYENSTPSDKELLSIANIVKKHYSFVPKEKIFGHREINTNTTCPSNEFLSGKEGSGWKQKILEII